MATFAQKTFNASAYATHRPAYGARLLPIILAYAGLGKNAPRAPRVAVDLGCGTGQVTKLLAESFDKVIGADASETMVGQARDELAKWDGLLSSKVSFVVSKAEDLEKHVEAGSVDLITAGQAAHWFDHPRMWPVLHRVLKPGGTVAFWGYTSLHIAGHPELDGVMDSFIVADDQLGPYWEPGVWFLFDKMRALTFPQTSDWDLAQATRIYFEGQQSADDKSEYVKPDEIEGGFESDVVPGIRGKEITTGMILTKNMTMEGLDAFYRTWSAVHRYHEKYPEDKARVGGGKDGDIVDRHMEKLKEKIGTGEGELEIRWPVYAMMIKRV